MTEKKAKLCMPILAANLDELKKIVVYILKERDIDILEWRLDAMTKLPSISEVKKVIEYFRNMMKKIETIGNKEIMLTYRTKFEGGLGDSNIHRYNMLIQGIISNCKPDYLDVELSSSSSDAICKMYSYQCGKKNIKLLLSRHYMKGMTDAREVELTLMRMHYIGADIPKVAYFVKSEKEAIEMAKGSLKAKEKIDNLIAIAMGEQGIITRKSADVTGSCILFVKPMGSKSSLMKKFGNIELADYKEKSSEQGC